MANQFLNVERLSATILGVLDQLVVLPGLVTRLGESDFMGAAGDTVALSVPARLDAREYGLRNDRSEAIVTDDLIEHRVNVPLSKHFYSAVAITDENLTLDIMDFTRQILDPQVRALARVLEGHVAAAIEGADYAFEVEAEDAYVGAVKARAELNKAGVPLDGRALLLGVNAEVATLTSPQLVRVDQSGDASALREAQIGRLAGAPVFVSQFIDPDTAYLLHKSAFALANVAPRVPEGATFGQSRAWEGYSVRWLMDYDPNHLTDRSVVSTFIGAASVDDGAQLDDDHEHQNVRAVKITGIGGAGGGDE